MTKTLDELLDDLETFAYESDFVTCKKIRAKIKEVLAQPEQILSSVYSNTHQPEQEPVAILQCQPKQGPVLWHDVTEEESNTERFHPEFFNFRIVYTTPPQRNPWVSLSEEDREQHRDSWRSNIHDQEIKAIESKLRELNEAPQRTWVGLTDEEVNEWTPEIHAVIQIIEAKLKEKNT